MGAFLVHRNEWAIAFIALLIFIAIRFDKAVKNARIRAKYEDELSIYKNAYQAEMIKEWVTSQYCTNDLQILCPSQRPPIDSCLASFDPPLRFVLDLPTTTTTTTTNTAAPHVETHNNCSVAELITRSDWQDRESVDVLSDDEVLTYFISHVLEQVRSKSAKLFRAEDRSIEEFEQSKLIETTLASILNLFSVPTGQNEQGVTISTRAVDVGMTRHIWTRNGVISLMHEAVLWHTHHKRHGSSATGAVARVSRQQPSFVFKFLPLVKEQIQNLELDDTLQTRLFKLYNARPAALVESDTMPPPFDQDDNPQPPDQCLWSHYEEGSLISQDCMLALETAPLKMTERDREGDFSKVLIHIYTCFSAAFMLWMLTRMVLRQEEETSHNKHYATSTTSPHHQAMMEVRQSNELSSPKEDGGKTTTTGNTVVVAAAESNNNRERIRTMQKVCLAYLLLSCCVGLTSALWSSTVQFTDFLDGLCLGLLGFLSLHMVPMAQNGGRGAAADKHCCKTDNNSPPSSPNYKHYKKLSSDLT